MSRLPVACAALAIVASAASAAAQPPGPPTSRTESRTVMLPDDKVAELEVTYAVRDRDSSAEVAIDGASTQIHDGAVSGSIAAAHGTLVVAYAIDDARAPFRIRAARGDGGWRLGREVQVRRPQARRDVPFAVAIADTPDGFAVFFQEVQSDDPSAAHTYLVKLDREGAVVGDASEVAVPWSLGAAAWNGHGYHLALFYPGDGRGMRLSMVSLTEQGQPEQHPDWASAPGYIADVHLVRSNNRIFAFYRGGGGGDRILQSDVTQIRQWGQEPPQARDHGAIGLDAAVLVSARGGNLRARAHR